MKYVKQLENVGVEQSMGGGGGPLHSSVSILFSVYNKDLTLCLE